MLKTFLTAAAATLSLVAGATAAEQEPGALPTALEARIGDLPACSAVGDRDVVDSRLCYSSCLNYCLAVGGSFALCDIRCEYQCGGY